MPILLNSETLALASKRMPDAHQIPEVRRFLRISNLLKVFDTVSLNEVISSQEQAISGFASFLIERASSDAEFANLLADREEQAQKLSGIRSSDTIPYQQQYLDELATGGELAELIETATRYRQSSDEVVQAAAKRRLAWALLQQDDLEKRKDGSDLAFQNIDESWAESEDYLLASGAAESLGDYGLSESTALRALQTWPNDPGVREHCRSFVMQRGSQVLRQRLDETGGNG